MNKTEIEALATAAEEAKSNYEWLRDRLGKAREDILRDFVHRYLPADEDRFCFSHSNWDDDNATVGIKIGSFDREISVMRRSIQTEDGFVRRLCFETDNIREITSDNANKIAYLKCAFAFAEHFDEVERAFEALPVAQLRNLRMNAEKADSKLECAEADYEAEEFARKEKELESHIKVGAKVNIGAISKYHPDRIYTIAKIMPKNIEFKEIYGRTKKDDLFKNLVSGEWKLVS